MDKYFEKLFRILNFEYYDEKEGKSKPIVTTGSLVYGVIVRSAFIFLLSLFLVDYFDFRGNWLIIAVLLWFIVAFPAYNRYKKFVRETEQFVEETLCGKCKYFDPTSKLCTIYDEHPSEDYIPCSGDNWEPKSID